MKFSTKAEYGLRAMVNLASAFPGVKNVKEISEEEGISLKYLERLVGVLRKNKLIKSFKGKQGGYVLVRKPESIKVGEIIEILEGPIAPTKCESCCIENKCSSSFVWIKLGKEIKKTLDGIRLSNLM
ncbi:HTH-type transcriptional regulator CymR [bacterium BMS3Abin15]|nr:HTH-type transcriptional regulator CymR [bacterium BMS3Abin15]HDZ85063.1 Rrf2 family transcriptional regulator [Candidatus Moranbacteria bacterium]